MNSYISILIADDDADEVAFLDEAISRVIKAYKVVRAKDGGQCMAFLKTNPLPELIFLDLKMPVRSGIECLQAIRENPLFDKTPVIIYAASHKLKDIDKCNKLGANFYMVKPVTLTVAASMVEQLLSALGRSKKHAVSKNQFVLMRKEEAIG